VSLFDSRHQPRTDGVALRDHLNRCRQMIPNRGSSHRTPGHDTSRSSPRGRETALCYTPSARTPGDPGTPPDLGPCHTPRRATDHTAGPRHSSLAPEIVGAERPAEETSLVDHQFDVDHEGARYRQRRERHRHIAADARSARSISVGQPSVAVATSTRPGGLAASSSKVECVGPHGRAPNSKQHQRHLQESVKIRGW
jgi:hypothetical protein